MLEVVLGRLCSHRRLAAKLCSVLAHSLDAPVMRITATRYTQHVRLMWGHDAVFNHQRVKQIGSKQAASGLPGPA